MGNKLVNAPAATQSAGACEVPDRTKTGKVVVLGIGNTLRGDEGVGIHALNRLLEQYRLAEHVQAIDGGVLGPELLPRLEGCSALLVIDAISAEKESGTIVRLEGDEAPAMWQQKLSVHQAGLSDTLALLRIQDMVPQRLVVWGIQPGAIDWSLELSPAVAAALESLVAGIAGELRSWEALAN